MFFYEADSVSAVVLNFSKQTEDYLHLLVMIMVHATHPRHLLHGLKALLLARRLWWHCSGLSHAQQQIGQTWRANISHNTAFTNYIATLVNK